MGDDITATATDASGDTSEFAANVNVPDYSTSTTIVTSATPSVYGHSVTFTATVSAIPVAAGPPTGTVTFLDGATVLGTATLSGGTATFTTSSLPAGSDAITAQYGGGTQYFASSSSPLTQNVTPAHLTVTAAGVSKAYGAALPAVPCTIFGLVNGDTPSVLTGALASSATAGSGVGTYTITEGTLSAGPNYSITFNPSTLTITPAPLTVTAHSLSKVYGAALPALTYTYAGLVNGDTAAVLSGALSTTATAGSGVGAYPVTRGTLSAGPNYTISYNSGTLTVTAAILSVTANNLSKVYGAVLPALTYTYSGLVNGDTAAVLSGVLSTSATAGSSVGTYPVTQGTVSAGPNYAIGYNPGTLIVTAAALSVTANNPSKVYGAALPALTYTYAGLVNGDTAAVLSGVLSTSATAGSGVGTYPVTLGTLSAGPNYTISYNSGTLTVTAAIR